VFTLFLLFVLFPELSLPFVFVFWIILSILDDLLTFGEFIGLLVLNTDLAQLVQLVLVFYFVLVILLNSRLTELLNDLNGLLLCDSGALLG
jgi:Zn-dependent protease with chaperone function